MTHDFNAAVETYWIAHDKGSITSGVLEAGQSIGTGCAHLETYEDFHRWRERLAFLEQDYPAAVAEWLEIKRLRDPRTHLADYRWRKETGGLTLSSGARVNTSREAQAQMNATLTALALGMVQEPILWKGEGDWLSLTTDELRGMAAEVAGHVNRCFRSEQKVADAIGADPSINVEAAFDAAYEELT